MIISCSGQALDNIPTQHMDAQVCVVTHENLMMLALSTFPVVKAQGNLDAFPSPEPLG